MFGDVGTTDYDLQFRCLGIPVRVTPWFWLGGILTGRTLLESGRFDFLFIWIACLFFSILVHEMGHAMTANLYGWPPQVILYQFGGLAVFEPYHGYTTARSIMVSFAGPLAGFILGGTIYAGQYFAEMSDAQLPDRVWFAIDQLVWINIAWGLVNLIPVLPLDGGRISQALFERYRPRDGFELSLKLSMVVAAMTAAYFYAKHDQWGYFPSILFAILFVENLQNYQRRGMW